MKLCISLLLLVFCFVGTALAADLVANPTSLSFGNVNQGQSKSLTFALKNTTSHKMRAELSADAPFTISPATPTMIEGQQIVITVTLPASAAAGNYSKKVTIKGSRLGLIPRLEGEVSLSAAVVNAPPAPDFSIVAQDNGNSVVGTTRTVGIHLICKNTTQGTMKTQVFVSLDGGAEQKMMDIVFVYTPSGQINAYGQQISTSVHTMKVRAVTDPDNSVAETNENNNQSILTLTY